MESVWARQFPRIDYRAPVQLMASGIQQPIAAEIVNLSQGGMFAGTPKPLPVGAEVCCDLKLDGSRRLLWGRVAWTREQPDRMNKFAPGMGIAFEPLSQTDGALLSEVASKTEPRLEPVRLRFAGVSEPISALVRPTDAGFTLIRPLSFLRLGSEVSFGFDGCDHAYAGRLSRVDLRTDSERQTPELQIDVEVAERLPERSASDRPENIEPIRVPMLDPLDVSPAFACARTGRLWIVAALCVAAAAAMLWTAASLQPGLRRKITAAPAMLQKALAVLAKPRLIQVKPPKRSINANNLPPSTAAAAIAAAQPAPAQPEPRPLATDEKQSSNADNPPPAAAAAPVAEGRMRDLQVFSKGSAVEVAIPVEGTFKQMVHRRLAHPDGMLIDLPHIHSVLDLGMHRINRLGIKRLWIRKYRGGVQMRVLAADKFGSYNVTTEPGRLRVVLEPL